MNPAPKVRVPRRVVSGESVIEAGVVLMDPSFQPIAIDQGATFILAARAGTRHDTGDPGRSLGVVAEVQDLMRRARPTGPDSTEVKFVVGEVAYTGRTFLVESQVTRQALIVLHLNRDDSAGDPLAEVGSRYRLTQRELEVARGIAIGLTNKELAQHMNIAPNTVKTFLRLVMAKLGVTGRSGIVAKLLEHANDKSITGARLVNGMVGYGRSPVKTIR